MFAQERHIYSKPQINLSRPTAGRMWLVSLCALLAIVQSSFKDSCASLIMAITAVIAAVLTESLIYFRTENSGMIKDGSAVTSALILVLLLPNQLHPIYAAMGAVFAMAVVKHSFGGLGANWMNPAIGGWLFVRFSWSSVFTKALELSPCAVLAEGMRNGLSAPDGSVLEILNVTGAGSFSTPGTFDYMIGTFLSQIFFLITGLDLPDGYIEIFSSTGPGIIADRGILGLLLGTIIITASQVNRAWIPGVYLAVYILLVRIFGALPFGGALGNGDIFFSLFSGGTLVVAFLLASDPVTGPKSNSGVFLISLLAGALTYLFRYQAMEPYSGFLVIAVLNTIVPLIRNCESQNLYETRRNAA